MSTAGCGTIRFWGFSPALDLLESASRAGVDVTGTDSTDPLRCLLVCPGDVRHVIKTVAAAHVRREEKKTPRALEVSIYEREPEALARHVLLLAVAVDFELPRRERAELLLELWANARLREKTATYLATKARELARVVTSEEGPLTPLFDLSAIKMKERDRLEEIFRSWAEDVEFDAVRLRDERLRTFYKDRYEARRNVLDWDYTMELVPLASIVHKLHFREWRMTGILFEVMITPLPSWYRPFPPSRQMIKTPLPYDSTAPSRHSAGDEKARSLRWHRPFPPFRQVMKKPPP